MNAMNIDAIHRKHQAKLAAAIDLQQSLRHQLTHRRCAGPCNQGRTLCPCPESCEIMKDDEALNPAKGIIYALIGSLAAWAAVIAFALVLRA
jgi:hypothetical protein